MVRPESGKSLGRYTADVTTDAAMKVKVPLTAGDFTYWPPGVLIRAFCDASVGHPWSVVGQFEFSTVIFHL